MTPMTTPAKDVKGKGRATETTPLLSEGTSSNHVEQPAGDEEQQTLEQRPALPRGSLHRTLINVFLGSLTIVVVFFVIGVLLVYSYAQRVRGATPDQLAKAIIWRGPSSMDVREMRDGGEVVVDIKGLIGVDTNAILGFKKEDDDNDGLFTALYKDIGRWGVGVLREVTVDAGQVVAYERNGSDPLAWAKTDPFTLRLTRNPGESWDASWLKPISLQVTARPSQDADLLQRFAQGTWEQGVVNVKMEVEKVKVQGGNLHESGGWRKMIKQTQNDLSLGFRYLIPSIPGIPEPRPPLIKMLQLVSYSLVQEDGRLNLYAFATIPSPLESIKFSLPEIPYKVSLLSPPLKPVPISKGTVAPVLTPPNISIPIEGEIIPLTSPESGMVLSAFLSNFLTGIPPPIALHTPLLPNITIETTFPVPDPPPRVLRNVTIKHMTMSVAPGGGMLASGLIKAVIALPPGLHVPVNATDVWPDVLVFDGPVHESESEEDVMFTNIDFDLPIDLPDLPIPDPHLPHPPKVPVPTPGIPKLPNPWDHYPFPKFPDPSHPSHNHDDPPPLPDPLPDRAFARIRPTDWIAATTLPPCDDDDESWHASKGRVLPGWGGKEPDCADPDFGEVVGWTGVVTAQVDKVPLQVLPGRDKEFRAFVSKVLWSKQGATAGIQGIAAVKAKVVGLLGDEDEEKTLELHDLPFEGTVMVGKKGL